MINETANEALSAAQSQFSAGHQLHLQGKVREALHFYRQALKVVPDHPEILLAMATALHDLELFNDALVTYQRVLKLSPPTAIICHNMGNTLLALDRYEEAVECYGQAIALNPLDVEALVTMGTALEQRGKYQQAVLCYEEALQRNPESAEAHWNLALALLRFGFFERGWQEFAWRWRKKGYTTPWRSFAAPLWQGESLAGKRILIHAEQAFGDTLQFGRYLPLVAQLAAEVCFECPAPQVALYAQLPYLAQVVAQGSELPPFDVHCPLLNLPQLFKTSLTSIPDGSYLSALPEKDARWQALVGSRQVAKVGLAWAGRRWPDPHRSCSLAAFAPLARLSGIQYFSLQVGEGAEQTACSSAGLDLLDLTGNVADFADSAALIHQLDLVITIDSAVAHLAGSLGKPTFLLVPFAPDWRWMVRRPDSPWYGNMRIFRQERHGCWDEPIAQVTTALAGYLLSINGQ